MTAPRIWQRAFSGSVAEVIEATRWVDSILSKEALPNDVVFALEVCLEELLTNIVRHGGNAAARIGLSLELFADRIDLVIEDDGKPFDVSAAAHHGIDRPLDEVQPGGLGVQLVHSFANRLAYQRTEAGNRVVAGFDLKGAGKEGPQAS